MSDPCPGGVSVGVDTQLTPGSGLKGKGLNPNRVERVDA